MISVVVCARMCGGGTVLQHVCRDQRSTLWSLFSPSIFMWVPGIERRLSDLWERGANTFPC